MGKKPLKAGSRGKAEVEENFQRVGFDEDDFSCGEPSLEGLFGCLLTMITASVEVPFGALDQQLGGGKV